jgi:hypothetical protein
MAKQLSSRQQQTGPTNTAQCRTYGHILRKTLSPGERLCTRRGKKVYCPSCTPTIPQGASLVYCLQHDPLEAVTVERRAHS